MRHLLLNGIAFIILFPLALFSGQVQKTYDFETPTINSDGEVVLPGCDLGFNSGAPAVPSKSVMLLLPPGEIPVSFVVAYEKAPVLRGTFDIRPISPQVRLDKEPSLAQLNYRSSVYSRNAFYPPRVGSSGFSVSQVHGYNIFLAAIHPVQYNPVTRELRSYSSITVTVQTAADPQATVHALDGAQKYYLSHLIDNPEILDIVTTGTSKRPNDYDYLIITADKFGKGFADFTEFNKRRGMKTKIETVENIKNNAQGKDTQEKVRNYIKTQYDSCRISFVLLGGDHELIPTRGMACILFDYDTLSKKMPDINKNQDYYDFKNIASDMYFGCLDGTWQRQGSNYFGEYGAMDIGHEVFIGRICIDNEQDQKNILNKIMLYCEKPAADGVLGSLLLGEKLWGAGTMNHPEWPITMYGDNCMEEFKGECSKNGYTTKGFSNEFTFSKLYAKESGDWQNAGKIIPKIKEAKPAWIDHLGHANNTMVMGLSNASITTSNFTNDGTTANFFLAYSQGCYPGSFDNVGIPNPMNSDKNAGSNAGDCLAEKWTNLATGAVACIFNSRYGFGAAQSTNGSAQRLQRFFHHALFNDNLHAVGQMLAYSTDKNAVGICDSVIGINNAGNGWPAYFGQLKWEAYETNLLGDPAMYLWSAKPQKLEPKLPDVIASGKVEFQTQPLARVGFLSTAGEVITTAVADDKGAFKINDELLNTFVQDNKKGELKVNIYAANYYPSQSTVKFDAATAINTLAKAGIMNFSVIDKGSASPMVLRFTALSAQTMTVSLYTMSGKCVLRQTRTIPAAGTYSFAVSKIGLPSGCYYALLNSGTMKAGMKLSVMK